MMNTGFRFMVSMAVALGAVFFGGCSTPLTGGSSIKYSFDPLFAFPQAKTYRWGEAGSSYAADPLLEANVQFIADRLLQPKGFSKTDAPALRIATRYESGGYSHELRALSLNVFRADTNQLVWRGVAAGTIRTDAASNDLSSAVQGILAHFPPTK